MSKSVVPDILALLEPYLERAETEWLAMTESDRRPTLPVTADGVKVNVRELVKALGVNPNWEQHFYRKAEIYGPINALARRQALNGIGSRSAEAEPEAAVKAVIARQGSDNKRLAEQLAEAQAVILRQQREIASLRAQIGLAQDTGVLLRTAPARAE